MPTDIVTLQWWRSGDILTTDTKSSVVLLARVHQLDKKSLWFIKGLKVGYCM